MVRATLPRPSPRPVRAYLGTRPRPLHRMRGGPAPASYLRLCTAGGASASRPSSPVAANAAVPSRLPSLTSHAAAASEPPPHVSRPRPVTPPDREAGLPGCVCAAPCHGGAHERRHRIVVLVLDHEVVDGEGDVVAYPRQQALQRALFGGACGQCVRTGASAAPGTEPQRRRVVRRVRAHAAHGTGRSACVPARRSGRPGWRRRGHGARRHHKLERGHGDLDGLRRKGCPWNLYPQLVDLAAHQPQWQPQLLLQLYRVVPTQAIQTTTYPPPRRAVSLFRSGCGDRAQANG